MASNRRRPLLLFFGCRESAVAQLFSLGIIAFMALFTARVPQNVPGKLYVDSSCIYCELCDQTAPSIFRECNEQGWAYVFKQPETPEELRQCQLAVECCPTESIGTDGDKHEH